MHPLKQYRCMGEIIRQGGYDAAYFNISEPMNCIGILAAHRQGIRTVIHSHSTAQGEAGGVKGMIKTLLNRLARNRLSHWGDSFYACSQAAGALAVSQAYLGRRSTAAAVQSHPGGEICL